MAQKQPAILLVHQSFYVIFMCNITSHTHNNLRVHKSLKMEYFPFWKTYISVHHEPPSSSIFCSYNQNEDIV